MSNTDTTTTPPAGQGTAGSTDIVTQLQNVVRQLSALVGATNNAIPLPLSLVDGGLGGDQSGATAGQIPVYPGSGGAAVPSSSFSGHASLDLPLTGGTITGALTVNGTLSLNPSSGTLNPAFNVVQSAAGTSAASTVILNQISITDTVVANGAPGFVAGVFLDHSFGGSAVLGGREGYLGRLTLTAPTSASNANRNYVQSQFWAQASVNDNGTGGSPQGALFGFAVLTQLHSGATYWNNLTGGEINVAAETGSSVAYKCGLQIAAFNTDAVQGSIYDTVLALSAQGGAIGSNDAILIGPMNGQFPLTTSGNILRTIGGTAAYGIDLSNTTISTAAFKSTGFLVDGSGNITFGTYTGTPGSITGYITIKDSGGTSRKIAVTS